MPVALAIVIRKSRSFVLEPPPGSCRLILEYTPTDFLCQVTTARAIVFLAVEDLAVVPVRVLAAGTLLVGMAAEVLLETVKNGSLVDEFHLLCSAHSIVATPSLDGGL